MAGNEDGGPGGYEMKWGSHDELPLTKREPLPYIDSLELNCSVVYFIFLLSYHYVHYTFLDLIILLPVRPIHNDFQADLLQS